MIGDGQPCYIVAEIGINHNGDLDLAKKTMDAAKASGADAVKFQNYKTEDFLVGKDLTFDYISQGKNVTESQFDMFKRCEVNEDMLSACFEYAAEIGIGIHSTPTNKEGVDALVRLGAPVLKNGSDYLTDLELIRAMGESGLPTVLSTGMSTLAEIDDAVRTFRSTGNENLVLLHCVSMYPTPSDQLNLAKIYALEEAFDCLVGFSDHSDGVVAATVAASMGVCWIEKHFTLDRDLPGPDHRFSSDPEEMALLVKSVREAEQVMGASRLIPSEGEEKSREEFRLSCALRVPVKQGQEITSDMIGFLRPGNGYTPKYKKLFVGKKAARDLPASHILLESDIA